MANLSTTLLWVAMLISVITIGNLLVTDGWWCMALTIAAYVIALLGGIVALTRFYRSKFRSLNSAAQASVAIIKRRKISFRMMFYDLPDSISNRQAKTDQEKNTTGVHLQKADKI